MMVVESESVAASVLRRSTNAKQEIDSKINAYEREPVPEDKLYGYLYFFGLFTSTHTAGTEFASELIEFANLELEEPHTNKSYVCELHNEPL